VVERTHSSRPTPAAAARPPQALPTDPAEARARLEATEAELAEMREQHHTLQRAARRWPRFWLQVCGPRRRGRGACEQPAPTQRRAHHNCTPRLHLQRTNAAPPSSSSTPKSSCQFGCIGLFAQLVGFAYLTWWELSWDVMEPIAYMLSLAYRWAP
jgi:hypothetical protein